MVWIVACSNSRNSRSRRISESEAYNDRSTDTSLRTSDTKSVKHSENINESVNVSQSAKGNIKSVKRDPMTHNTNDQGRVGSQGSQSMKHGQSNHTGKVLPCTDYVLTRHVNSREPAQKGSVSGKSDFRPKSDTNGNHRVSHFDDKTNPTSVKHDHFGDNTNVSLGTENPSSNFVKHEVRKQVANEPLQPASQNANQMVYDTQSHYNVHSSSANSVNHCANGWTKSVNANSADTEKVCETFIPRESSTPKSVKHDGLMVSELKSKSVNYSESVKYCNNSSNRISSECSSRQVKCGAVYVTDEERTKSVTKHVVSLSSHPDDKKKPKSSKYTVAVGSSFGHIHTFLKESDNVLKTYENTQAEDKCLLLIKKPKSASKQMLKAHSWADVSVGDMHIRNSDGTLKQDPYKIFKDKFKKKSDLSLPPDEWNTLPNQKTPFKGPTTNQNSSFKSLSSVEEGKEDNKSDIIVHKKLAEPVPNISNSYPFIKRGNNRKSQSLADLTEAGTEINNNRNMGGALSQHPQRPKVPPPGPPPPKPQRTHAADATVGPVEKTVSATGNKLVQGVTNSDKNGSQPDIISNMTIVNNRNANNGCERTNNGRDLTDGGRDFINSGRDRRTVSDPQGRVKHDSGFHSEAPLSCDEFKQDLIDTRNGTQMTSSPIAVNFEPQNNKNHVHRNHSNPRAQRIGANQGGNQNKSDMRQAQSVEHKKVANEVRLGPSDLRLDHKNSYEQNNRNVAMRPSPQTHSKPTMKNQSRLSVEPSPNNMQTGPSPVSKQVDQRTPPIKKKPSPVQHQKSVPPLESRPRSNEKLPQRRSNEFKSRKSLGNVTEGQMLNTNNDTVTKAQSLGDLSVGCTFSLVGQKKVDSPSNSRSSEFSGTQLMKHIRNYKEMTQNGNSPFRGKTLEDVDNYNQYFQNGQEVYKGGNSGSKLKHYGSLQHLPISYDTYNAQSTPNQSTKPVQYREKTPLKPRRLPQTPGDVHEKKRQISDMMRSRMSADSASTSPSSSSSNRGPSIEPRPGGVSATPSVSDREVSELFRVEKSDKNWKHSGMQNVCNNVNSKITAPHVPPSYDETCNMNSSLLKSSSFGLHDHGIAHNSGGRLSDSRQMTLTSQSTIDSGYITNDPDPDTISTSNYAKTLKQSAQSLYVSNKLYQQSKGEVHQSQNSFSKSKPENYVEFSGASAFSKGNHSQQINSHKKGGNSQHLNSNIRGGNSNYVNGNHSNVKHNKDVHTRTWLENHPGTFVNDQLKLNLKSTDDKTDNNNNRHPKIPEDHVTNDELTRSLPNERLSYLKQPLSHHKSEVSAKDVERSNQGSNSFTCKSKGMSISMSQGLNMIGQQNHGLQKNGSFLSKSQTKFTGSLKDLIGADKQIIPIETLRLESANSTQTLPGNWKCPARTQSESSLKFLGKPSMFQLLQNYNLYAVRLRIPENFVVMDNIRLIECEVVLSTPWLFGKDSTSPLSPQGSYAKLGGPNSAFRPVAVGGASAIKSVSMVTVMEVSNQLTELIESGQLQKGDLLIEVNEVLMMGEDLSTLSSALHNCQGELLLTVARDKARDVAVDRMRNSSTPTDDDFRKMEQKLTELTTELRKKDRTLKQLSALLPWKLPATKGSNSTDNKDQDGYMCNLSEDEFIV
ncbi:hypothetical protein ACF0H5_023914 [Mactra antiquata]